MQYSPSQLAWLSLIAALLILPFEINSISQPSRTPKRPAPRKIGFAEAQKLLADENEGNLSKQPGKFSRTKLSGGQVLEQHVEDNAAAGALRASFEVQAAPGARDVELRAFLRAGTDTLTETWSYAWQIE